MVLEGPASKSDGKIRYCNVLEVSSTDVSSNSDLAPYTSANTVRHAWHTSLQIQTCFCLFLLYSATCTLSSIQCPHLNVATSWFSRSLADMHRCQSQIEQGSVLPDEFDPGSKVGGVTKPRSLISAWHRAISASSSSENNHDKARPKRKPHREHH